MLSVSLWLIFLLAYHFSHQSQDLPGLGMAMGRQFRIDQLPVDSHLELSIIRWDEFDLFDQVLILFEQFFHQAHGPTGVVSDRAVNDLDVQHRPSANFEKLYPPLSQMALLPGGERIKGRATSAFATLIKFSSAQKT